MSIITNAIRTSARFGIAAALSAGLASTALAGGSYKPPSHDDCPPGTVCDIKLFHEDFDGYNYFPDERPNNDWTNLGRAKISEGADNNWYAGRFFKETDWYGNENDNINEQVAVQKYGGADNWTPVGRAEGGNAMIFKVDTTGYSDVQLSFEWRTFNTNHYSDKLAVSFTTLDLSGYFGSGMTNDFYDDFGSNSDVQDWLDDNWVTETFGPDSDFKDEIIDLPSNSGTVWVAFWAQSEYKEFAKFDNINVTGCEIPPPTTIIPEPATLSVLSLGSLALLRRRRRNA
ncbi:PEP-CTERM sorting domain-containing protein [Planctomycetales bacterium ZRK34]|nr:PEP-CTERM sorting domain-containing protein [Planctomycetales bacterium ZRK34]